MAVSVLDIQVNSQGAVRNLRDVSAASKAAQSGVDGLGSAAKGAERSVGGFSNAIGNLLKIYAGVQAIKFVFVSAAEIETQTKSIAVLTGSVDRAKQIISELQALGAVTPFTSTELIDAAKRLNAFGVEADKVVETTRRLADVSGATGAELQGLVTAYGQVQAKGRLQGEELLQFQERGIALQDELRKMYGMTGEEFQKALSKGRISAEAVEVALQRLTDAGGKYANGAIAQSDTLNGKLSTLQDSFQRLAANIGTFFAPAFKFLISKTDELINRLNRGAYGVQAEMQQRAGAEKLSRAGVTERTYKDAQGNVYSTITGRLVQAAKPKTQAAKPIPGLLSGTAPSGGGSTSKASTSDAERAAKEAAKESERVRQVIRDRLAEGQLLQIKSGIQDKIAAAEASGDRMLAARLQGQQKEIDIQYQYAQALAQEKNIRAQEAIIFEGNTRLVANQRDTQRELATIQRQNEQDGLQAITAYLEKQYELNTAIQQQNALAESVSSTLGQGMTSVFDALIQGSDNWGKSLQQIASKVLVDIANQLIRIFVIEQAVSAIKSFLSPFSSSTPLGAGGGMVGKFGTLGPNYGIAQRAIGGPVSAGTPYMVGERGPELFMPSRGGSIIPNNALGGGGSTNVVVNVNASGSSVQGDQAQSRQLGVAISAAVQAELVKQKRPGGLLA